MQWYIQIKHFGKYSYSAIVNTTTSIEELPPPPYLVSSSSNGLKLLTGYIVNASYLKKSETIVYFNILSKNKYNWGMIKYIMPLVQFVTFCIDCIFIE